MAITRTALTDDSGSGTDGTIINNAWKTEFYDQIDAFIPDWATYTPTITGLTVGNATVQAAYAKVSKIVCVEVLIAWGTTTAATGSLGISLPVNNTGAGGSQTLGRVGMLDVSAGSFYAGMVFINTTSTASLYANGSPLVAIAATVPFTWAVSDQFHMFLTYRTP